MSEIGPNDLVLVAVLKTKRDLEIARVLGWYRIPIRSAPKTLRVDWIAFYQPGAFGDEKHAIRYVAPVRGFELTTRADLLRDEPDHPDADAPYFKVQLGTLERLVRPIPASRWRRITFLYTTGERLLGAEDAADLAVPPSAEHDRLWHLLRERGG
jgi:hypothetical protein